ncbi:hypothetical protein OBBRIDRAFT_830961 [Obba rivulosa]|uniref:DUF6534 domain-containing protein n=1 Tax=Obba rivulosa TaxID=1052685 RepID=A0A8E2DTK0_9APHY|nr:hypothetical protein OBBRIDRAFT_830961 [Obba rivulosa]
MASSHSELEDTLGAFLIGVIISTALYGLTAVQTYQYFRQDYNDPMTFKALVSLLCVLDTTHEILLIQTLYAWVIGGFGNPEAMITPSRLLCLRIRKLGMDWFLVAPIFVLFSVEFVCSIVWFGLALDLKNIDDFNNLSTAYYVGWGSSLAADILIASSQAIILWRRRTGFNSLTDGVVRTLMLYSVNTGLLTSVVATVGLITFATMPDTLIYVAFYHQVSKLLLNAFLATYNARQELRHAVSGGGELVKIPLPNGATSTRPHTFCLAPEVEREVEDRVIHISVNTSTDTKVDV